jgi:HPt (histidine-containing phosphotransfer) domain-containing protein
MTLSPSPSSLRSPEATGEPVFDPALGIEAMGSDESFHLILESILESLAGNLPEIRQALDAGDVAAANGLLHSIKGYAPLMCTNRLVELVSNVESVSKTAAAEVVIPLYAELEPVLRQLLAEIQAYLDTNSKT